MPFPQYSGPRSSYIQTAVFENRRLHKGDGDMWPLTWAADGNLYAAAGDNLGSPMNFWRISGMPHFFASTFQRDKADSGLRVELINNFPLDPYIYSQGPGVHPSFGFKPSGLISYYGLLYLGVSNGNYGELAYNYRQRYTNAWIVTSSDYGQTWNREATPRDFFTGKLSAPSFLQFGRDYEGAPDAYIYAYFTADRNGVSMWENADMMYLGRAEAKRILERGAWTFFAGLDAGSPKWEADDGAALPVFEYPDMTGENHVSYNKGIGRYLMGNYSFTDSEGATRCLHANEVERGPSQLTLFEAENPWGPWKLFYQDDNWGTFGDYQPVFPTKWMSEDGLEMYMVSSGSYDDYNFTIQKLTLVMEDHSK